MQARVLVCIPFRKDICISFSIKQRKIIPRAIDQQAELIKLNGETWLKSSLGFWLVTWSEMVLLTFLHELKITG